MTKSNIISSFEIRPVGPAFIKDIIVMDKQMKDYKVNNFPGSDADETAHFESLVDSFYERRCIVFN